MIDRALLANNVAFVVQLTISSPKLHLRSVGDSQREHYTHHIAWTREEHLQVFLEMISLPLAFPSVI